MSVTVDTEPVEEFVRSWLPPPPATILEVGAGTGELARRLIDAGYDVTPIDPIATDNDLVLGVSLDEIDADDRYDVVVASRTLHHISCLDAAVATMHGFVADGGRVILNDFGWERLDEPTGRWLYSQLQKQDRQATGDTDRGSLTEWFDHWRDEHAHLHRSDEMLALLRDRFTERYVADCPYLTEEYVDGDAETQRIERTLITDGTIRAAGFRFVGEPNREH